MFPSLSFPTIFTLLILTLSFLSSVFLIHPVLAQDFRPTPNYAACSAFIEGQGFYILGGRGDDNFMIDLSVSWNTSDPVFKKLEGGPRTMGNPCAMTKDELFTLVEGTGYVYNVSSGTWRVIHNNYFELETRSEYRISMAAADPETGIVYLPDKYFTTMLSLNLRTNEYNISDVKIYADESLDIVVWNAYLKGMIVEKAVYAANLFSPSKVSKSSTGWSKLRHKDITDVIEVWICSAPAHGGTKMVYIDDHARVYVWNAVKKTWRKGPLGPAIWRTSCAVTGDQFILWGGMIRPNTILSNSTFVFNIKTMQWTSKYIAPPSRSTTTATTHTSQPSQTPTQDVPQTTTTTTGNPTDIKLLVIIVAATGILLAINVWFIVRYRRRGRRSNHDGQRASPNGSSADSLGTMDDDTDIVIKGHSIGGTYRRDPSDPSPNYPRLSSDHNAGPRRHIPSLLGRLHQGSSGARELPEHPHTIVEDPTSKRELQDGFEVQLPSQHPHTTVGDEYISKHGHQLMQQSARHYGDKEEFRDQ
ncbi:MAG: hypothetical protein J3Q66DRAFT_324303 [Benniella sp.]|nr:MAG: hypothetical protein J3Q66DRAFT_324303 [Benniella sp.]